MKMITGTIRSLKWKRGIWGIHHEYAEGVGGTYHIWGSKLWAPPEYKCGQEANPCEDSKLTAQTEHERRLLKFVRSTRLKA